MIKNKKIYISGSGGMLGSAFYDFFNENNHLKCSDIDTNEEWIEHVDIREFENYKNAVEAFNPDYLFHLGALTDLEECEKNIDNAYLTNTLSVEHASKIANFLKIPLLYISTAGIFDGKKEEYDDWDIPNPLGHYARSKYLGEVFVEKRTNKFLTCRAGWMMGGGPKKDKKFIKKILLQIKKGKKELFIVNDKFGTPTYTFDFAKNVSLLLKEQFWGTYNLVCEGLTSREEVTKYILEILNLSQKIKINLVESSFFSKEYFAPRPNSERLINKKLNLRKLNSMRSWKTCLKEYILKDYKDYL